MKLIQKDSTDVVLYFKMLLVTDGREATGVTPTAFRLSYTRNLSATVGNIVGIVSDASVTTHIDNKVVELNSTTAPGLYMACFPDAAFADGVDSVVCTLQSYGNPVTFSQDVLVHLTDFNLSGTAAANLNKSTAGIVPFVVGSTSLGLTSCSTDLTLANDIPVNGSVVFLTGPAAMARAKITDFANTDGVITFASGIAAIPQAGDLGVIL